MGVDVDDIHFQKVLLQAQNEASIDGILVISPAGRIISYNRRFVDLWRIPKEVVASKSDESALKSVISQVVHPEEFMERVAHLYAHPEEKSFDEVPLVDGRTFDRYSSPIRDEQGKILGRIWFFRDVSDHKEIEKTVVDQQRMISHAARMSALGEMAGGIAHEINNPLGIIHAHAEILLDLPPDKFNREAIERYATKIRDTSLRISNIINGLRMFSRNGEKDPFDTVRISQIIEDTLSICVEKCKSNDIIVRFEPVDKNIYIQGRATQLMQVFLNLLNNAADAIEFNQEKWIEIKLLKSHLGVRILITDSGPGISADLADKIFEPFFTTKGIGKGTGLGLSISKGIIEDHGGTLLVDRKSKNTCLIISLPLDPKTPA